MPSVWIITSCIPSRTLLVDKIASSYYIDREFFFLSTLKQIVLLGIIIYTDTCSHYGLENNSPKSSGFENFNLEISYSFYKPAFICGLPLLFYSFKCKFFVICTQYFNCTAVWDTCFLSLSIFCSLYLCT